jgi:hypothetical protein
MMTRDGRLRLLRLGAYGVAALVVVAGSSLNGARSPIAPHGASAGATR